MYKERWIKQCSNEKSKPKAQEEKPTTKQEATVKSSSNVKIIQVVGGDVNINLPLSPQKKQTLEIEHFDLIDADFLSRQPELLTPESAFKRVPRYEWKAACSKHWVTRKALTEVLERLERLGKVPGIIPIKGEGGSGKTALLKQLAVALFLQGKTVRFSKAGFLNLEFEDIANLNDIATQNNDFSYIFLDDFHKFPADLQENIINQVDHWWNVILLVTYRDPIPGAARGIKRFQPITLNLQDDISLFVDHLQEISKESSQLAHLLKEKESFINQIKLSKQIRLFIFLYLLHYFI